MLLHHIEIHRGAAGSMTRVNVSEEKPPGLKNHKHFHVHTAETLIEKKICKQWQT